MASTAIPAVKAAMLEILTAATGEGGSLEGIAVSADKQPERPDEFVWIWKAKSKRKWASLGQKKLEETVMVTLRVVAIRGGVADSEARAIEIAEAVETEFRKDLTLGGAARFHLIEELDDEPRKFDQAFGCAVLMTLTADIKI